MACLVWRSLDLIVEHREVEGKTKADGVGGLKLRLANVKGSLVGILGAADRLVALITRGNLGKVAEVVSLHLEVEHLALGGCGVGNQVVVQKALG
jgi:hypothetical protein